MISRIKIILLTGAAVLATAAAGTGMAAGHSAQPPPAQLPAPASFSTAPGPCAHGMHGKMGSWGILRQIEHGEATLKTAHGQEVVDLQRGTVESVSPQKLTIRSADGFSATYAVNQSTKIRKDRKPSDIAQVMTNDKVLVVATKSGNTATATHIVDTGGSKATNH